MSAFGTPFRRVAAAVLIAGLTALAGCPSRKAPPDGAPPVPGPNPPREMPKPSPQPEKPLPPRVPDRTPDAG